MDDQEQEKRRKYLKIQWQDRAISYLNGSKRHLHRCRMCWTRSPNRNLDNGFTDESLSYKHADDCEAKGAF
jgi:hypothetical protein